MLIEEHTELGQNVNIVDRDGQIITHIKTFDTVTKEAEIYAMVVKRNLYGMKSHEAALLGRSILNDGGRSLVTFKCHLPLAKAIDKRNGLTEIV